MKDMDPRIHGSAAGPAANAAAGAAAGAAAFAAAAFAAAVGTLSWRYRRAQSAPLSLYNKNIQQQQKQQHQQQLQQQIHGSMDPYFLLPVQAAGAGDRVLGCIRPVGRRTKRNETK